MDQLIRIKWIRIESLEIKFITHRPNTLVATFSRRARYERPKQDASRCCTCRKVSYICLAGKACPLWFCRAHLSYFDTYLSRKRNPSSVNIVDELKLKRKFSKLSIYSFNDCKMFIKIRSFSISLQKRERERGECTKKGGKRKEKEFSHSLSFPSITTSGY